MELFQGLHVFPWLNPTVNNCNTYLLNGSVRVLIDPGHKHLSGHVKDELQKLNLSPRDINTILITHGHPDHMEGIELFQDSKICMHREEYNFIREVAPHYGGIFEGTGFEPHILLQEGTLKIGEFELMIIHTPGHSPGSICIYWPEKKTLVSGDLVFAGGVGRTDLPGGNSDELKRSIRKVMDLDMEYLLPGHGEFLNGSSAIKENFQEIESFYFPLL